MIKRLYLPVFFFLVYAGNVYSTSCADIEQRIFGVCDKNICTEILYVKEITSQWMCSRRAVVSQAPEWAKDALEYEISKIEEHHESSIYELKLNILWHGSKYSISSFDGYVSKTTDQNMRWLYRPQLTIVKDKSIVELSDEWKAVEKTEFRQYVVLAIVDWGFLFIFIVITALSVRWFRKDLLGSPTKKTIKIALLTQLFLFILSFLAFIDWLGLMLSLAAPIIFIVWIYEAIFYIYTRLKSKNT